MRKMTQSVVARDRARHCTKGKCATVDYLQAMRALWTQPQPAYHGKFVSFGGV